MQRIGVCRVGRCARIETAATCARLRTRARAHVRVASSRDFMISSRISASRVRMWISVGERVAHCAVQPAGSRVIAASHTTARLHNSAARRIVAWRARARERDRLLFSAVTWIIRARLEFQRAHLCARFCVSN